MSFQARYPGHCVRCGERIYVGDEISWARKGNSRGKVYHITCPTTDAKSVDEVESQDGEKAEENYNFVPAIETPKETEEAKDLLSTMATALQPYLESKLHSKVDANQVKQIVAEQFESLAKNLGVTRIVIEDALGLDTKDLGIQHKQFPTLLKAASAKTPSGHHLNVWITGPAGSGKTVAAEQVAKALGLTFYFTGSVDTPYPLMGFIDANGNCVRTPFREAYEHGGVFLFDEVDSSSPSAVLAFNAALANGTAAFPDGMVKRHADFVCIAAANTWGLGASNDYVGRFKMDAAFLDRFVAIAWEVDESLEMMTCGNLEWCKRVQAIRQRVREKGVKIIISPRASYYGAGLLAVGLDQATVEALTLRKAMTDDQWRMVCS